MLTFIVNINSYQTVIYSGFPQDKPSVFDERGSLPQSAYLYSEFAWYSTQSYVNNDPNKVVDIAYLSKKTLSSTLFLFYQYTNIDK